MMRKDVHFALGGFTVSEITTRVHEVPLPRCREVLVKVGGTDGGEVDVEDVQRVMEHIGVQIEYVGNDIRLHVTDADSSLIFEGSSGEDADVLKCPIDKLHDTLMTRHPSRSLFIVSVRDEDELLDERKMSDIIKRLHESIWTGAAVVITKHRIQASYAMKGDE